MIDVTQVTANMPHIAKKISTSAPDNMRTMPTSLQSKIEKLVNFGVSSLNLLQPVAALAARLYVANVFFLSGLTKIRDWGTTVALFNDEYKVPFLPPEIAAVMGTAGELGLPVLLVIGLATRFGALGLTFVNAIAVISLAEIAPAALQQHVFWGALLAGIAIFGPGQFALDHWVPKWWNRVTHRS